MARVRLFLSVSHISSVYMTDHARATSRPGDRDIFLVDIGTRRPEVVRLMMEAAAGHRWALLHDLSTHAGTAHSFRPSLRKRITRKWKEAAPVRGLYRLMLRRWEERRDERSAAQLKELLAPHVPPGVVPEVFAHIQSLLHGPVQRLFPSAVFSYFEHGLGDYHYIVEKGRMGGPFHALFAEGFQRFLQRRHIGTAGLLPLSIGERFPTLAAGLLAPHITEMADGRIPADRPLVLILLEAVDMYQVPEEFWGAYIDHVLATLDRPERFHFLLKPHPSASPLSLALTEEHCRSRGLSCSLLDAPLQASIAAEVLFARWADRTEHVFCLFSSACFYLARLFPTPRTRYHYSITFMERWTGNAPPMYKRHFEALKPLIEEVFAERCEPY